MGRGAPSGGINTYMYSAIGHHWGARKSPGSEPPLSPFRRVAAGWVFGRECPVELVRSNWAFRD